MKTRYLVAAITLALGVLGWFVFQHFENRLIRCGPPAALSNVRQLQIVLQQYVLDKQAENPEETNPYPPTLDALVPNYLSKKELEILTREPVVYTRPHGVPSKEMVILLCPVKNGRVEGYPNTVKLFMNSTR